MCLERIKGMSHKLSHLGQGVNPCDGQLGQQAEKGKIKIKARRHKRLLQISQFFHVSEFENVTTVSRFF